ncbi:hypothetical protein ACR6C2_25365 [Streptomyces sp. INA 01156]
MRAHPGRVGRLGALDRISEAVPGTGRTPGCWSSATSPRRTRSSGSPRRTCRPRRSASRSSTPW